MDRKNNPFGRIRLIYRRSSPLLKCVVLAAIVLSTVALLTLRLSIQQTQAKTHQMREQAAILEQANNTLEVRIAELGTVQSVKQIAGEQLGLVDPNSQFFSIESNSIPD